MRPWTPIVEGELFEQLRRSALSLCGPVADVPPHDLGTVGRGAAGRALFLGWCERLAGGARGEAARLLGIASAAVAEQPMSAGLFSGLTGIAWSLEYAANELPTPIPMRPGDDIDDLLLRHLEGLVDRNAPYDLISGPVGIGVYFLERLPRPKARSGLQALVELLTRTAHGDDREAFWLSPTDDRGPGGEPVLNLGVAHGLPGVIAILGQIHACGVEQERISPLLERAVYALLLRRIARPGLQFPAFESSDPSALSRLGWCYGDLGIAAALLSTAENVGEPAWRRAAEEIAANAALTSLEDSRVVDAGLCHGAAGVAHIFNRLFQGLELEVLRDAALRWYRRTLALERPLADLQPFPAFREAHGWRSCAELLEGQAGVGLAFLAATSSEDPTWDRLLLVSGPPRR